MRFPTCAGVVSKFARVIVAPCPSDVLYSPHVIGSHWLCEGPGWLSGFATGVEIFVDLRVVLHFCMETAHCDVHGNW